MITLVLCAVLAFPQAPAAAHRPAAAQANRDTIYVAAQAPPPTVTVQAPPATVNVEAPSQWSTIALGVAGLVLLGFQLWIMSKQTDAMNRQTTLLDKQTVLLDQQAAVERTEAIGTFYRIAHDIADELGKANLLPGTPIPANYETHPRQMLREASRLFAPLGTAVAFAASGVAMYLDHYFSAVEAYNADPHGRADANRWHLVQRLRRQVGSNLDATSMRIPTEMRWKYSEGTDYDFGALCAMPAPLAEQMGYADEEEDEAGPAGEVRS